MNTRSPLVNFVLELAIIAMGVGLIAVAVPTEDRLWIALGCAFLAVAGLNHLWLALSQRQAFFSLCDLQAATLFISYFGGAAVTLALSEGGMLGNWLGPQNDNLLSAVAYTILFCAALVALGRIETRFWRGIWSYLGGHADWPLWAPAILVAIGIAQAINIIDGQISYQGLRTIGESRLPYGAALVVALSWPLAGICGWILGHADLRRRVALASASLLILPVQIVFSFSHGRRVLLFQCLIFATCFVWARRRAFSGTYLVVIGILCLPLVYGLWVVFLGLRIEHNFASQTSVERRDIFQRLESTLDLMQSNWSSVIRYQDVEVTERVFVIGYLAELIGAAKPQNALGGKAATWEIVNGIPRMLLASKQTIARALQADERSIAERYGLSDSDQADSLLTTSFVDLHWLGVLYAPFVLLLGAFGAALVHLCRSHLFGAYVVTYCFLQAITPEQYFFTQSLNMGRLLLVLVPVVLICRLVLLAGADPAHTGIAQMRKTGW